MKINLFRKNYGVMAYYKSSGFNTLNIEDLKKLYIALQGVKADIKAKVD